jgi:hypothetical protein
MLQALGFSAEANALYQRLLARYSLSLSGDDVPDDAVAELVNAGLAIALPETFYGTGRTHEQRFLVATTPDEALARLIFAQEQLVLDAQERTLRSRRRLIDARAMFDAARTNVEPGDLVRFLIGQHDADIGVRTVFDAAVNDLSICDIHTFWDESGDEPAVVVPKAQQLQRTVFRTIYDHTVYDNLPERGRKTLAYSRAQGEVQRYVPELPLKMMLADETVAVIALTRTGVDGALLVRSKPLLAMLRSFFDLLWEQAEPIDGEEPMLTTDKYGRLPELLAAGLGDETIARVLGVGVRTVRRDIAVLMDDLGATSRYQAGALAERRGLIDDQASPRRDSASGKPDG